MKKCIPLLVLALLLFATAVVSADPPPGVAPAVKVDPSGVCSAEYAFPEHALYEGVGRTQFSNGATGHSTVKCKMKLVSGLPTYDFQEFVFDSCVWRVVVDGRMGMMTIQCFGDWSP